MLLAILFIVLSVLLGISITYRVKFAEGIITKVAFGLPTGIVTSSFILLALYVVNGYLSNIIFYLASSLTNLACFNKAKT